MAEPVLACDETVNPLPKPANANHLIPGLPMAAF